MDRGDDPAPAARAMLVGVLKILPGYAGYSPATQVLDGFTDSCVDNAWLDLIISRPGLSSICSRR